MKAIVAVAASMLTAVFHILKRGVAYNDLGNAHFERRDRKKITLRLIRRLTDMGLTIEADGVTFPATSTPATA